MRSVESHSLLAWMGISFRWLVLLGLSGTLLSEGGYPSDLTLVFLASGLWNLALSTLALFNWRLPQQRLWSLGVDLMAASLIFYFSGTLDGTVGWVGLLPVIPAALNFEKIRHVFIVGLLSMLSLALQAVFFFPLPGVLVYALLSGVFYVLIGLAVHGLAVGIVRRILEDQQDRLHAQQELERLERERQGVLYKVVSTLSATLNYQRILDAALDLGAQALAKFPADQERLVSAVLLFTEGESRNGRRLHVGSARRFTPSDLRAELPGVSGLAGSVIDNREPLLTKSVHRDRELARFVALRACRSAYCVPLRSGLDAYGVILFAHPDPDYFNSERREVLDIIGNQVMIAMQNARLYHDLELEKERMIEIQEEARVKLARDLHDGPTQSISALAMRVDLARRLLERDRKAAAEELNRIEELARHATMEIRHMLFTLRPLVLESQGLVAALELMAEKMWDTYQQPVLIEADEEVISQLEMSKQAVIFYIAEEAVNNARKHAQAEHIWVRLRPFEGDLAQLEIEDDGVGFNLDKVEAAYDSQGSLGLVNMRERADLVNGVISMDSAKGKGTRVRLLIPLTAVAADILRQRL